MKEFESWWDIFVNKHCETCVKNNWVKDRDTARKHIEKYKHYYKRGYIAALEWVLSLQRETDDGAKVISSAHIKKELEDE